MKEPLSFFVPGIAKPAGSKRAFVLKKGGVYTGRAVVTDDCKKSKDWKADVRHAALRNYSGPLWTGPLSLTLRFAVTRPKSHYGRHGVLPSAPAHPTVKPDVTKLLRGVEDALTGVLYEDDAQIVSQRCTKRYHDVPGVYVILREEGDA